MNYFVVNVRYNKTIDNGAAKRVTEPYLVNALTCTEAEARITEHASSYIPGEFTVSAVKESKIAEIFRGEGGYWYLAKLAFVTLDEKSGVEKRSMSQIMVEATDFLQAYNRLMKGMNGTMADFDVVSIAETKVVEVLDVKLG